MTRTLFIAAGLVAVLLFTGCISGEKFQAPNSKFQSMLDEANYCEVTADCAVVPGKCPFDCYVLVNKSESGAVAAMLASYESNCEYGCIQQPPVACVNQKCVFEK